LSSSSNTGRYRFTCFYRGQPFYGWQSQPDHPTVQDCLEQVWSERLGIEVSIQGSGRTDRGVNALGQVAHLDIRESVSVPFSRWEQLVNERLPADIEIYHLQQTNNQFHARHSASRRYYGYRFLITSRVRFSRFPGPGAWTIRATGWDQNRARWLCNRYNQGVPTEMFSGRGGSEHDSEIWPVQCKIRVRKPGEIWLLVSSKSFRYKMVRCLAGAMKQFTAGQWSRQELKRRFQRETGSFQPAPPQGCYLLDVAYSDRDKNSARAWNRVLEFFR